jgi:hypothetical protein
MSMGAGTCIVVKILDLGRHIAIHMIDEFKGNTQRGVKEGSSC